MNQLKHNQIYSLHGARILNKENFKQAINRESSLSTLLVVPKKTQTINNFWMIINAVFIRLLFH